VEQTPEPGGLTAALTGRYLPVTASVAAWNRISDLARQLKTAGVDGHLDELRVQVYLALLTGQALNVAGGAPQETLTHQKAPRHQETPANRRTATRSQPPRTGGRRSTRARRHISRRRQIADSDPVPTAAAPVDGGAPGHAGLSVDGELGSTSAATVDGASAVGEPGCTSAGPAVEDRASAINGADGATERARRGWGRCGAADTARSGGRGGWLSRWTGAAHRSGRADATDGTVNLTVPLATLLGITDAPGELARSGR